MIAFFNYRIDKDRAVYACQHFRQLWYKLVDINCRNARPVPGSDGPGHARARSVVASFWTVDDEQTRALMARFYENLWTKRLGRLEALREAQLWMLRGGGQAEAARRRGLEPLEEKSTAARRGPTANVDWAAFVLSGDWR